MSKQAIPGLFFTGTNTEVGKTYVASLVAARLNQRGVRVGVYKPVASGCVREHGTLVAEDALRLWTAAGKPGELHAVCPQRFEAPLAPHLAAQAEDAVVDEGLLRSGLDYWRSRSDIVIVEGAGGLMSPISDNDYVADLADELGFPLVVVAPNELGVINQTLQTLITAATFRNGLDVAGVILNEVHPPDHNDVSRKTNRAELESRCVPPILAVVDYQAQQITADIDWFKLATSG